MSLLNLILLPLFCLTSLSAFAGGNQLSIHLSQSQGELADARDFKGFTGYFSYERYIDHSDVKNSFKGIQSLSDLENDYLRSIDRASWNKEGLFERSVILSRHAENRTGQAISAERIMTEYAIQYAIQNPRDWAREFRKIGPRLSLQDKVLISSQLGGEFLTKYDVDRSLDGVGVVTIEELWASLQPDGVGGVCRDIAKAQAQILVALGVPQENLYIMAYSTPGGSHATIAIQNPENPRHLIKMNYDYITQSKAASDNSLLVQERGGSVDTGLQFRIFNIKGEPIGRVPTEISSVMRDVFDSRLKLHPITANFNLNKAGVMSPWGTTLGFEAYTANGDLIQGIGHTYTSNDGRGGKLKFSLAYLEREAHRTDAKLDQQALYASLESDKKLAFWNIGRHTDVAIGVAAAIELQFSKNHLERSDGRQQSHENWDFSNAAIGYVEVEHRLSSQTTAHAEAGVSVYGDFKDVSAAHSGGYTFDVDYSYVDGRIDHEFDDYVGSAEVGMVFRELGNTAHAELGLRKGDIRGFVGVQGRTSNKTAAFVPGSTRHVYAGMEKYEGERRLGRAYYSVNETGKSRATIEYKVLLGGKKSK